jgi:uncharacterized cofD-like protein
MVRKSNTRVVVIGGGTGSFTLLQGLKKYTPNITALVNMLDDGSSTGQLRDELGVLPPGDARQNLVALSESPKLRDLFTYRFEEGSLKGHTLGNLFLTALEKMTGNFAEGVEVASEVLGVIGKVVPITLDNAHLVVEWPDGTRVHGEVNLDEMHFSETLGRPTLSVAPKAKINPEAKEAILQADLVIISAGDVYTSIGASLSISGVSDALKRTQAKIAYMCNLVTKPGHTTGFTVSDHAAEIERLAGVPILDFVVYNTAKPPKRLFTKYTREGELLVEVDEIALQGAHYKAVGQPLVAPAGEKKKKSDPIGHRRSFIRHDGDLAAQTALQLVARA